MVRELGCFVGGICAVCVSKCSCVCVCVPGVLVPSPHYVTPETNQQRCHRAWSENTGLPGNGFLLEAPPVNLTPRECGEEAEGRKLCR